MGKAAAAVEQPSRVGVGEEAAWAEIHVVFDDETSLKVVLGVGCGNLNLVGCRVGLLLGLQDLVEMPDTLLGFKQGIRNDKTFEIVIFFFGFGIG